MKARNFIFMMLVAITANSCILEDGDRVPKKTEAGRHIWDITTQVISNNLFAADLTLKLDLWMSALEEEKNQIEDRFFPDNKIRYSAGVWNLTGTPIYIYPDDKSIHTPGAKWKILFAEPSFEYQPLPSFHLLIECTGELTWRVSNYDNEGYNENMNLDLELTGRRVETPTSAAGYIYTVVGEGDYIPFGYSTTESLIISYTISSEMTFYPQTYGYYSSKYIYRPYSGDCSLTVNDSRNSAINDKILVEILSGSPTRIVYNITYKGVTETWD